VRRQRRLRPYRRDGGSPGQHGLGRGAELVR
jgi:hypothetical protein